MTVYYIEGVVAVAAAPSATTADAIPLKIWLVNCIDSFLPDCQGLGF